MHVYPFPSTRDHPARHVTLCPKYPAVKTRVNMRSDAHVAKTRVWRFPGQAEEVAASWGMNQTPALPPPPLSRACPRRLPLSTDLHPPLSIYLVYHNNVLYRKELTVQKITYIDCIPYLPFSPSFVSALLSCPCLFPVPPPFFLYIFTFHYIIDFSFPTSASHDSPLKAFPFTVILSGKETEGQRKQGKRKPEK